MNNPTTHNLTDSQSPLAQPHDWARIGLWLVAATMVYNVVEGAIALWAGIRASSIALVGFGLDSYIECAAAAALFWRLTLEARGAPSESIEKSEQRVHRFVGATFVALALYVLGQAGWTLLTRDAPGESFVGIILAVASLVIMPLVSWENSMQPRLSIAPHSGQKRRKLSPARTSRSPYYSDLWRMQRRGGGGLTPLQRC